MDWKILAALGVAVLLFAAAFLTSGMGLPDLGGGLSGMFTAFSLGGNSTVAVDAALDRRDITIDTPASSVTVELLDPSSVLTVGKNTVDLSAYDSVKLELTAWNGKVSADGTLAMDGTAAMIKINGIAITLDKDSRVFFSGLGYRDLDVKGVSVPKLSFASANGYVYVDNGKTTVRVASEPLELGSFEGNLRIDTSLRFSGVASRLSVSGRNQLSVQ